MLLDISLTTSVSQGQFTGSATYTRATVATVFDNESVLRNVLSGEARFQGARRVRNFVAGSSENFTNANWTKDAGGTGSVPVLTANYAVAPDGTTTATRVVFNKGAGTTALDFSRMFGNFSAGVNVFHTGYIKSNTGSPQTLVFFANGVNNLLTVTTSWTRFSFSSPSGSSYWWIMTTGELATTQAADFLLWGAQQESVTGQSNQAPSEYVSVGVLSTPFHGAMVDGVKYFSTTNGNSVASNVVTEATGSSISDSVLRGYLSEPTRTNVILQSNAFTTTWNPTLSAPTQNQIGPDGATSAWTINGLGANYCEQTITLTATTYTASVFVKKTTGATEFPVIEIFSSPLIALCTLDTNNGVATVWVSRLGGWTITTSSAYCVDAGNFWRVSLTFLATAAVWGMRLVPCGATSSTQSSGAPAGTGPNVYYGAQLEVATSLGNALYSYIPTTTAAVIRNADFLTYPFAGNTTEATSTLYAEVSSLWTAGPDGFACMAVGFGGGLQQSPMENTYTTAATGFLQSDGTTNNSKSGLASTATGVRKRASSWGALGQICTGDGLAPGAPQAYDGSYGSTAVGIGCNPASGQQWGGTIRRVRLFSTQFTAVQLQGITA